MPPAVCLTVSLAYSIVPEYYTEHNSSNYRSTYYPSILICPACIISLYAQFHYYNFFLSIVLMKLRLI